MAVVLLGTFDTKGREYEFVRDLVAASGQQVVLVDTGVLGAADLAADIGPGRLAELAGTTLDQLRERRDRGHALTAMADGARRAVAELYAEDGVSGVLTLGGSGGSAIAAAVMRALPIGLPKLLVSTMAAGDVSVYVGTTDVTLMYSVVDVAGINSISRQVLGNAAAAIAGMAAAYDARRQDQVPDKPLVAATMFGVTTPAVDVARERLGELGYEVLVFHATGSGGRTVESLAAAGHLAGVLDLTTTELADEAVGGVLSAGPDRLTAAAKAGVPQVVSLGAMDMVNFGPRHSVPARFEDRRLLVHNDAVTLMRTSASECAEIGGDLGRKLAASRGPVALHIPRGGFSAVDIEGGPFWDPGADLACTEAALAAVAGSRVAIVDSESHVNDPEFATAAADHLHRLITGGHRES